MAYRVIEKDNINKIADEVIENILNIENPFSTPTLVFHNMKVAQWFKSYFLKTQKRVLMNVKFVTLSVFINDIVNPDRKYTIMDKTMLRRYVLKALTDKEEYSYDEKDHKNPVNYIFNNDGNINGINLYEFASKLSSLFMQYEVDGESISGWEEKIYKKAISLAQNEGSYTTKTLFEKKDGLRKPLGDVYIIDNSYITNLFKTILNEMCDDNIVILSIAKNETKTKTNNKVISAPSMLREVETVHSIICKTIQSNRDMRFNDFLVYAPDIQAYSSMIHRVFEQDDNNFPSIPYRIAGESKERKEMVDALCILYDIANKRFFTRKDLYKLAKNYLVQKSKGINDDDVDAWMETIDGSNTYRGGKYNDWEYLKRRLLLSVFVSDVSDVENCTEIGAEQYLPYSSMDMDYERIDKLIELINSLQSWVDVFSEDLNKQIMDSSMIERASKALAALFSLVNSDGEETNYMYREVNNEISELAKISPLIPANTLILLLIDAPNKYSINPADLFTYGVTFMNLNSDDIVSARQVFVLGMSSDAFPRIDIRSELDLSTKHKSSRELDEISIENVCVNAEEFTFSYVNKNLKTDEVLYRSVIMQGHIKDPDEMVVPLDETRDYSDLFTQKEFNSKKYYDKIGNAFEDDEKAEIKVSDNIQEQVLTLKDISEYLKNTFIYKYSKILGKQYDNEELINNEYEPIDVSPLTQSLLLKEMVLTDNSPDEENRKIEMEHRIPNGELGTSYRDYYQEESVNKTKNIIESGYKIENMQPLKLSGVDAKGKETEWILKCNIDVRKKEDPGCQDIYYAEPIDYYIKKQKINEKSGDIKKREEAEFFLNMYTYSLMDIATKQSSVEYRVHLGIPDMERQYNVTPEGAVKTLNELYKNMTDYEDLRYMDMDFLVSNNKKALTSMSDFINKINEHNSWKYFSDNKMVECYSEFGYDDINLESYFSEFLHNIRDLILYLEDNGDQL